MENREVQYYFENNHSWYDFMGEERGKFLKKVKEQAFEKTIYF